MHPPDSLHLLTSLAADEFEIHKQRGCDENPYVMDSLSPPAPKTPDLLGTSGVNDGEGYQKLRQRFAAEKRTFDDESEFEDKRPYAFYIQSISSFSQT